MGSRRYRGSVSVEVQVDVCDVLDEISTEDLIAELQTRDDKPSGEVLPGATIGRLSAWDTDSLMTAIRANDAQRALDLMKAAF